MGHDCSWIRNFSVWLPFGTYFICMNFSPPALTKAELNAPEDIITCAITRHGPLPHYSDTFWAHHGRETCIDMGHMGVAMMTTMFTVGGFVASILAGSSYVSANVGRRSMCMLSSSMYVVGSALIMWANSLLAICIGRFIAGLGAGSSLVMGPLLISELTPPNHRGLLGSLVQLAVAIGILSAQLVSYVFANNQQWRLIFFVATIMGLVQFVALFTTHESPKWMVMNTGDVHGATSILHDLRSTRLRAQRELKHYRRLSKVVDDEEATTEQSPLVASREPTTSESGSSQVANAEEPTEPVHATPFEFMTSLEYWPQFRAVALLLTGQQLCGMNGITFYGVSFLSPIFKDPLMIACSISLCNVICAIAVSPVVDRWGRKPLVLLSVVTMSICAFAIAIGMQFQIEAVVAIACFGFVAGYSAGMAPIPFLMISELAHHESVGAAQAVGGALNWLANISLAYFFPLVEAKLGGCIFYGFSAISAGYAISIALYVPETHGKSHEEVWDSI